MTFCLTFGQNSEYRNGWIEVYALNYSDARQKVINAFGFDWSKLYTEDEFDRGCFPSGKLGELR